MLAPEPEVKPEEEGPITKPMRQVRRSLALLTDGRMALSLTYVEGGDIEFRSARRRPDTRRRCHSPMSKAAISRVASGGMASSSNPRKPTKPSKGSAACEVAAHIGGPIQWGREKIAKDEPEGGEGGEVG